MVPVAVVVVLLVVVGADDDGVVAVIELALEPADGGLFVKDVS